ncbi:MAG: ArgR family transcriptional regulator [Treponema sp.]|nr:ArgR family transcriptional regulator [Treponema sp.]
MKERQARLKAIKDLIKTNPIESQETLLSHLQKEGFDVTQATLSRDLKVLKVGKVSNGHSGYAYTLPGDDDHKDSNRTFARDFMRGFISMNWSGNMVVIRTYSGHSDSVAMALDSFDLQNVLGTISGRDNTVFAVLKEGVSGEDFLNSLKKNIPELADYNPEGKI